MSDIIEIVTMDDCIDDMLYDLEHGLEKGTTTHIDFVDRCWKWRKGEFNITTGYMNEGKAEHLDNQILTTNGWKTMGELSVGDRVFDEQGKPCNVVATSPVFKDRDCYKITFVNGAEIIVDKNHEWLVDTRQSRSSAVRQQNRESVLLRRRSGNENDLKKGVDQRSKCLQPQILSTEYIANTIGNCISSNYSINLCKPLELDKKELLINPYILGAWLGDGHTAAGMITSENDDIPNMITDRGITMRKLSGKYGYGSKGFMVQLRELGVLNNKHIPSQYLNSTIEDRLELLRGLMDTDGYTDKLGRCEFTTVLPTLCDNVYQLLSSLGINVYFTQDISKLYGVRKKDRYRLRFKTGLQVFNLERKKAIHEKANYPRNNCRIIKSVEYAGKYDTKCIEVDSESHLYLTGRDFIATHNSSFLRQLCLIKAITENWKFAFSAPEDYPAKLFFDDCIHSLSGQSTDKDNPNCISKERYIQIYKQVKDNFYFIYAKPPNNTIKLVLDEFEKLMQTVSLDAVIIDPLIKFARPSEVPDRDDLYANYLTTLMTDFARRTNTSTHLVIHQVTPKLNDNGLYPKPSAYSIRGGGIWSDGVDNVLFVHRDNYAKDKMDTTVTFGSQKIKRHKLVAIPQEVRMRFDRRTNRYTTEEGNPLFDFDKYLL